MIHEKFAHNDPDEFHDKELTLHDCVANQISFEKGTLRFSFPDGFWVTPNHIESTCINTVRTGSSVVDFVVKDIDDILIRVYTRHGYHRFRKTIVEIWNMEQLISAVNSGKHTIEFVTQYRSYYEQMWHCVIHSKKKPYYRECQIYLPETEAAFRWNDLRPDCEW